MANIAIPNTLAPKTTITSAAHNANYAEIQNKYNAGAVQTDVAKTVTVTHTFNAVQNLNAGANVSGGLLTATGGAVISGSSALNVSSPAGQSMAVTAISPNGSLTALQIAQTGVSTWALAEKGGAADAYIQQDGGDVVKFPSGAGLQLVRGNLVIPAAAALDTAAAGALNVGPSVATFIVLGKAGVGVSAPGGVTAALTGNVTGNVSGSAASLATPRAINGVNFDGTAPITVTAAAGTLTGATLAANVLASSLTSVGVLASPHMTGAVVDSGGLTVTAGGAAITGNSSVTGNLSVSGTLSGAVGLSAPLALAADASTTLGTPQNSLLAVTMGANQTWRIDFDLGVSCNNTGGVQLQFSVPSGATGRVSWNGQTASNTTSYAVSLGSFGAAINWSTFNSSAAPVYVRASVYVATSATAGPVTLQWNAVTAGQTAIVLAGSTLLASRIS